MDEPPKNGRQLKTLEGRGGLKCKIVAPNLPLDSAFIKAQKINCLARTEAPYFCNASSQRNDLIKLTYYETTKRAYNTQEVKAKGNPNLRYGGPSQRPASGTNTV